jgi:hypothetical protein
VDPKRVAPLRLAQCGPNFFPVLSSSATVEEVIEVVESDEAPDDALTTTVGEAEGEVQLPDIKEDLASSLRNVLGLSKESEEWSKKHFSTHVPLNLASYQETIDHFQERLRSGDGLDAVLIGANGAGKSTLVDLSIYNTMHDESTYADGCKRVPEAIRQLLSGSDEEPPTLEKLLQTRSVPKHPEVSVQMLSPNASATAATSSAADGGADSKDSKEAARLFGELEGSIRKYCEVPGQVRPKMSDFLLPCGKGSQSTTTLHTRVRSGGTVHALLEFATEEELQQKAYLFVQLRRDLGDDDPSDLRSEEKDELLRAWHTYISVKDGTVLVDDLPDFVDDSWPDDVAELEEEWSSIPVCEALRSVVKSNFILYLGGGTDLHLDRKHVHDLLLRLNDKEQLQRIAAKNVDIFFPAAVLEGGCSFVDLPGFNDADPNCLAQSMEGLQRAGVVYVLLLKSLHEDKNTLDKMGESGLLRRIVQNKDIEVIFITNREAAEQSLQIADINTAKEKEIRDTLEKRTRSLWKKTLLKVKKELERAGEGHSIEPRLQPSHRTQPQPRP